MKGEPFNLLALPHLPDEYFSTAGQKWATLSPVHESQQLNFKGSYKLATTEANHSKSIYTTRSGKHMVEVIFLPLSQKSSLWACYQPSHRKYPGTTKQKHPHRQQWGPEEEDFQFSISFLVTVSEFLISSETFANINGKKEKKLPWRWKANGKRNT